MRQLYHRLRRSSHIHGDVCRLFRDAGLAPGAHVLDVPAGDGVNSRELVAGGYRVTAADLFPEHIRGQGFAGAGCDMTEPLPFRDGAFDGVLHLEGIEHIDNQVAVLAELARVVRPGGVVIVTTPNVLQIDARVATMLTGHAHPDRAMVSRASGYWGGTKPTTKRPYFGHVFLINAFQLRFYLSHVGLDVVGVETARWSRNSVLLAPLLYVPIAISTWRLVRNRRSRVPDHLRRTLLREALSGTVLFGRKLVMIARRPEQRRAGVSAEVARAT